MAPQAGRSATILCARQSRPARPRARALWRPAASLVYSTCSLEPEENEGVVAVRSRCGDTETYAPHSGARPRGRLLRRCDKIRVVRQMVEIVPSILSADFARLAEEIARVERGGATMLHLDVMDGHFVPNLTIGPPVVESHPQGHQLAPRRAPDDHRSGPLRAAFHRGRRRLRSRSIRRPARTWTARCDMIQSEGAQAGVVLNPATPVAMLDDVLDVADYVLIMSVNPGFGGQKFIPVRAGQGSPAGQAADGEAVCVSDRNRWRRSARESWRKSCAPGVTGS